MKKWIAQEVNNNPDHDRAFKSVGISREQVWIQRTPMGDFAVASFEVEDAGKTFGMLAASSDPYIVKFRDLLQKVHGFDFSHPAPLNEQVANWTAR